jgi:cyclopropane fatty-acyl-phospholipid synthase-like methyltransferase
MSDPMIVAEPIMVEGGRAAVNNPGGDKNREIYDHADDEIWRRAVYQPVHEGWHFAHIGGRGFLDFIGDDARLGPESQVLDLCCGSGAADCYLAERFGCAVTGLDINASQIERARWRARGLSGLRFIQADAAAWRPDRSYDLVFALDSLTLIANLPAFFGACHAALRPGGRLAVAEVVAGAGLSEAMRDYALAEDGAITLVSADQLGAVIEAAGFGDVEIAALGDEAVHAFALIHQSVQRGAGWDGVPAGKIEEWKHMSERYLAAFVSGELGYVRIVATAL